MSAAGTGGTGAAAEARLTVMCGGSEDAVARVTPVIETFGKKIVYCGPVGAGHTVKAVNQALLAVHILATAEALVAAAPTSRWGSGSTIPWGVATPSFSR